MWKGLAVTEGTLAKSIRELRVALRDDAGRPRFIETAHGRGVRRPRERAGVLQRHLANALGSAREVVFVTGEPGIGKTALVDAFTAALPAATRGAR